MREAVDKLTNHALEAKSVYGMEGRSFLALTFLAIKTRRADMAKDRKELERILVELENVAQLVDKTKWDEVTDAWGLMYSSYEKLDSLRARIIVEHVFANKVIRKNVGAAMQLHDIAQPDKPPDGVLKLLGVGGGKAKAKKKQS